MPLAGFEATPRYAELVYRLLGEETDFVPPGFDLEVDRPEYSFLKRELLWATVPIAAGPVAAQFAFIQVFNPAGSNRIAIVAGAFMARVTPGNISLALTTTIRGASQNNVVPRDTRWNSPITPTVALLARDPLSFSSGSFAAAGSDLLIANDSLTTANLSQQVRGPFPIILAPGTGFVIAHATVNEALTGSLVGYSRAARPEELTL